MTETSEMIRTTTILVHPTRRSPQPCSPALADPRQEAEDLVALDLAGQDSTARPALMGRHASVPRASIHPAALQTMRHVSTCASSSVAVEAGDSVGDAAACLSLATTVLVSVEDADMMEVSVVAGEAMKGSVGGTTTRSRAEVMTASVGDRTDSVEVAGAEAVDLDQV